MPEGKPWHLVKTHWADKSLHLIRNNTAVEFPLRLSKKSPHVDINDIGETEGLGAIGGISMAQSVSSGLGGLSTMKPSLMTLKGNIKVGSGHIGEL
jgi:hypothetical protein